MRLFVHVVYILSVLISIGTAAADQNRSEESGSEYLINIPFAGYETARLNLQFSGSSVTGYLLPLLYVSADPIPVSGDNYEKGKLRLNLPNREGQFETREFRKELTEDRIIWRAVEYGPEFYRYRNAPFSDTARALSQITCGPIYGSLAVVGNGITAAKISQAVPGLQEDKVREWPHEYQSFEGQVFFLDVPVGTELHVTKVLRSLNGVNYVNLTKGACGGDDISYFSISRSIISVGDSLDASKFARFLRSTVSDFLRREDAFDAYQSELKQMAVRREIIEPFPLSNRISIKTPSFVSRAGGDTWDRFDVVFKTASLPGMPADQIAIVMWAERLLTGTAAARPNRAPPRDEYISILQDRDEEAAIATLFGDYASSRFEGYCRVSGEALFFTIWTKDPKRANFLESHCGGWF